MSLAFTSAVVNCKIGDQWKKIFGSASQIYANSVTLWSVRPDGKVYYCTRPCKGVWTHVGDPRMRTADVDSMYSWGIGKDGYGYQKGMQNSGGWVKHTQIPNMIDIAASSQSFMWFINKNKEVLWLQHYTSTLHKVQGKFDQIDAESEYVYALNVSTLTVYVRPVHGRGEWRIIPGNVKYISTGIHDLFAIGTDDNLYRCTIPCAGVWESIGRPEAGVVQIDATVDALFAVTSAGVIYYHELPL